MSAESLTCWQRSYQRLPITNCSSRDILAHALLLFTRGIPVIYYGDEQGFTGKGGDAAARQDMFGSKVPDFVAEKRVGGGNGAEPAFNEDHPLFRAIRDMISVRQQHQALQSGIQMVRYAAEQPGLFVVSRIDRDNPHEILVVAEQFPRACQGGDPKPFNIASMGTGLCIPQRGISL